VGRIDVLRTAFAAEVMHEDHRHALEIAADAGQQGALTTSDAASQHTRAAPSAPAAPCQFRDLTGRDWLAQARLGSQPGVLQLHAVAR